MIGGSHWRSSPVQKSATAVESVSPCALRLLSKPTNIAGRLLMLLANKLREGGFCDGDNFYFG